jgi:hypothetical protein
MIDYSEKELGGVAEGDDLPGGFLRWSYNR